MLKNAIRLSSSFFALSVFLVMSGCRSMHTALPNSAARQTVANLARQTVPAADSATVADAKPHLILPQPAQPIAPPAAKHAAGYTGSHLPGSRLKWRQAAHQDAAWAAKKALRQHHPLLKPTHWDWGGILQVAGTLIFLGSIVVGIIIGSWAGFGLFLLGALLGGFVAFCGSFLIDGELS